MSNSMYRSTSGNNWADDDDDFDIDAWKAQISSTLNEPISNPSSSIGSMYHSDSGANWANDDKDDFDLDDWKNKMADKLREPIADEQLGQPQTVPNDDKQSTETPTVNLYSSNSNDWPGDCPTIHFRQFALWDMVDKPAFNGFSYDGSGTFYLNVRVNYYQNWRDRKVATLFMNGSKYTTNSMVRVQPSPLCQPWAPEDMEVLDEAQIDQAEEELVPQLDIDRFSEEDEADMVSTPVNSPALSWTSVEAFSKQDTDMEIDIAIDPSEYVVFHDEHTIDTACATTIEETNIEDQTTEPFLSAIESLTDPMDTIALHDTPQPTIMKDALCEEFELDSPPDADKNKDSAPMALYNIEEAFTSDFICYADYSPLENEPGSPQGKKEPPKVPLETEEGRHKSTSSLVDASIEKKKEAEKEMTTDKEMEMEEETEVHDDPHVAPDISRVTPPKENSVGPESNHVLEQGVDHSVRTPVEVTEPLSIPVTADESSLSSNTEKTVISDQGIDHSARMSADINTLSGIPVTTDESPSPSYAEKSTIPNQVVDHSIRTPAVITTLPDILVMAEEIPISTDKSSVYTEKATRWLLSALVPSTPKVIGIGIAAAALAIGAIHYVRRS
ncbi:hypothetical protein CC80DRAFT_554566 [Byssothecium circinans]|uniref:Uncharacterized protein n=1 Tax=Byssothecium circinans TaxID=147558 RepID=A0A6A5TBI0_9PLEO|nr:hypothetical protein CC80DRAFT_554566 [Byssothecium circinans]